MAATLVSSAPASAARGLDVGFVDGQFSDNLLTNPDPKVRDRWFNRLNQANGELARINLYWSQSVGGSPPVTPTDPADPSYNWSVTDAAVISAAKHHVTPVLTVFAAPTWAEGPRRPADVRTGAWKPDARRFGQFARAVARRYSGKYTDAGVKLPRVRYYEAWNEPNLPNYISPQWNGKKPAAPGIYRNLLNEFYAGVHSVGKKNRVIAGGTSPFGDPPGGKRMHPYFFWREVLCLKGRKLRKAKGCVAGKNRAHFDIFAHNAINAVKGKGPTAKPFHPDDGVPSNFGDLGKIVRAAEKHKTLLPKGRHPGWSTETWYESKPGDPKAISARKQALFQEQSLYVLWKEGASVVFFLQLRDTAYDPAKPGLYGFQTGVYLVSGKPKPSLTATQFPFVADRKSRRKVLLWGKAPRSGKLTVTQQGKRNKKVTSLRVKRGKVFTKTVNLPGTHRLRAKVGKSKSLTWKLR